jgi:hypothetical protein
MVDHRRLVAADLRQRRFAVAGHHDVVGVEAPAQLLLQARIVFDDQQFRFFWVTAISQASSP